MEKTDRLSSHLYVITLSFRHSGRRRLQAIIFIAVTEYYHTCTIHFGRGRQIASRVTLSAFDSLHAAMRRLFV